jgi:hypothetical protein
LGLAPFAEEAVRAIVGKNALARLMKLVEGELRGSYRVSDDRREAVAEAWAAQRVDPDLIGHLIAWLATGKEEFLVGAGSRWRELVSGQIDCSDAELDELVEVMLQSARHNLARAQSSDREALHVEAGAIMDHITREVGAVTRWPDHPAVDRLNARERLAEMRRASIARCAARWLAVGLTRDEAQTLAHDPSVGAPSDDLLPKLLPEEKKAPVVVWTAPMGSGKSIAAERVHQAQLSMAVHAQTAPIPVLIPAAQALPSLEDAIARAAAEVGEPRRRGASIVVDGVDEVGYEAAGELLMQARVLAETWPSTTVLLTSRPVPVLQEAPEHLTLPALASWEQQACVRLGAGSDLRIDVLGALPSPIRATLGQPLFALLTGIWMREHKGAPRAPVDLLVMLGERATRKLGVDQGELRVLAARSVARELGPVHRAAVRGIGDIGPLLATGMVSERAGGLVFSLPAMAQWFAAQSLLLGELQTESLLDSREDLDLWLYPLALAAALGSAGQVETLMSPLFKAEAGFAFRVLDTAFGQAILGGCSAPPWREGGHQVRRTLQTLANALGALAPMVVPTDRVGRLLPMAVSSGEVHLNIAFYSGADPKPEVFAMPADLDVLATGAEWAQISCAQVGVGAAWAWRWALSEINHSVGRLLQQRELPIPLTGPLADEEVWKCATTLAGASARGGDVLDIEPLLRAVSEVVTGDYRRGAAFISRRDAEHDLRLTKVHLERLREQGETQLRAPVQMAELQADRALLNFWGRCKAAKQMYERALVAYRQIVDRSLSALSSQMEHRVLLPVRLVGYVNNDYGLPRLVGYLEPLPEGRTDEVVMRIMWSDRSTGAEGLSTRQRAARPHAARWLANGFGGMTFDLGNDHPVADIVYRWIADDLHRLGLGRNVEGTANALWLARRAAPGEYLG